jgi:N-acetyl-anhydromuramyl-L-alanine amidase AmpD
MAIFDACEQRHLPEFDREPSIVPRTIISHSIVGSAESAYNYFETSSALESHFVIPKVGAAWQLMDTDQQADAQKDANDFALSIETGDNGDPDNDPWTANQLDWLVRIHLFCVKQHPKIQGRIVQNWDGTGFGFHAMYAPGPWSSYAKTCPGKVRQKQWREEVIPEVLKNLNGTTQAKDETMKRSDYDNGDEIAFSNEVRVMQWRLNAELERSVKDDGLFGQDTEKAVKEVQNKFGYAESGTYDLPLSERLAFRQIGA